METLFPNKFSLKLLFLYQFTKADFKGGFEMKIMWESPGELPFTLSDCSRTSPASLEPGQLAAVLSYW